MTDKKTVILLPESDAYTVCVAFVGKITKDDHDSIMTAAVKDRIEKNGFLNLVIVYSDEHAYEASAADANMRSIMAHARYIVRAAYVNPPKRKLFQTKMLRELYPDTAELKSFYAAERDDAIAWAKQGRPKK